MIFTDATYGEVYLFPFRPDQDYSEEHEFFVTRTRTYDGGESRELRSLMPYREQSVKYTIQKSDYLLAYDFLEKNLRKTMVLPKWHLEKFITQDMVGSSVDTSSFMISDFKSGSFRVMIFKDGAVTYNPSLMVTVTQDMVGSSVIPCEIGYVSGNVSKSVHATYTQFTVQYVVEHLCTYSDAVYSKFLNFDFIPEFFLRFFGGISYDIVQQQTIHRGDFDYSFQTTDWAKPERIKGINYIASDLNAMHKFMRFFYSRKGSFSPFWYPCTDIYLRPLNASGLQFTVPDRDGILAGLDYKNLVFFNGITWTPIPIVSKVNVDGVTTFTMDSAVPSNFIFAHFLSLHRLEADRCSITYSGNGVIECTSSFCEMVKQP